MVLADAQFGIVSVMRPLNGFETTYEGLTTDDPIYLFPEGENIDKLAKDGVAGYDRNLARGLKVPLGARVVLWLPNLFFTRAAEDFGYQWVLIWRLRTVVDFRNGRNPWHLAQDKGADNTNAPTGQQQRFPVPAAYNTIGYIQTEPTGETARSVTNVRAQDLEVATTELTGPLLPDGATRQPIQQGVLNPAVVSDAEQPTFLVHEVQAIGDELIIAVRRPTTAPTSTWAFGSTDLRFSQFLGQQFPNVGVYVMMGAAP